MTEAGYEYLFLRLAGAQAQTRIAGRVQGWKAAAPAGAELIGLFTPQLGWATDEAALLLQGEAGAAAQDLHGGDSPVATIERFRLAPTARPRASDRPAAGGIWVHRWFEVDTAHIDEFVELSMRGWRSFESLFDARIFGLFKILEGARQGLLLITRYADHGAWEASRDPTTEAMEIFRRRAQLTRRSWAASTRLVAP